MFGFWFGAPKILNPIYGGFFIHIQDVRTVPTPRHKAVHQSEYWWTARDISLQLTGFRVVEAATIPPDLQLPEHT